MAAKVPSSVSVLLLLICLCWFNFQTQPGTLGGQRKLFPPLQYYIALILKKKKNKQNCYKCIFLHLKESFSSSRFQDHSFFSNICRKCAHAQLRLTLCDPGDCSLQGSSVHGIFQARIMEQVAIPPPGALPNPGINPRLRVSCIGRKVLYHQRHLGSPLSAQSLHTIIGGTSLICGLFS